ncbi:unnamed protein product [Timema podura]|uniref:Uncharacterized protein n=1 Tax=Timema podura TaxID=61482 RepID=A0ABN7NWX2_TIMPD|nr:unnamed protein product [Timema podura]
MDKLQQLVNIVDARPVVKWCNLVVDKKYSVDSLKSSRLVVVEPGRTTRQGMASDVRGKDPPTTTRRLCMRGLPTM